MEVTNESDEKSVARS